VAGQYHGKDNEMSNAKATIKIFMPLEVQPVPVEGAEYWVNWQGRIEMADYFGEWLTDSAFMAPFGAVWVDNDGVETADTLRLNVDSAEIVVPFFVTSAKVVCQDGVWGWLTEAEEAQL